MNRGAEPPPPGGGGGARGAAKGPQGTKSTQRAAKKTALPQADPSEDRRILFLSSRLPTVQRWGSSDSVMICRYMELAGCGYTHVDTGRDSAMIPRQPGGYYYLCLGMTQGGGLEASRPREDLLTEAYHFKR